MMKRLSLFLFVLLHLFVGAQPSGDVGGEKPVKWTITSTKGGPGWSLQFKADVQDGWSMYTQHIDPNCMTCPLPTLFAFDTIPGVTVAAEIVETGKEVIEHPDPILDNAVVKKFKGWATYTASLTASAEAPVTGYYEYQTCNDQMCLPPERVYFRVQLASGVTEMGPVPFDKDLGLETRKAGEGGACSEYKLASVDLANPVMKCSAAVDDVQGASLWKIFLLGFLGGLVALLTPCVFPMIPLTVSFFTKGSDDRAKGVRNALTYGGFILLIYLLFSVPFHVLGSFDPQIFNAFSTNPWLNLGFFVIFIVFAISFFGYFEITLPASWVNRMDQNANKAGGVIGIFFMAFTLALVSFSCTGPILGSLLAGAITSTGGPMQLTAGMGGFGLALALPFALFALFPGWLNSLPRSGSWLNSVKVVLGFVEVALAFKFLSTADLVSHWGILPYELFLAVWVLCAIGIVVYLLGRIRFPHDSPVKKLSPMRWGFTAFFAAAVAYLLMGFRYDEHAQTFSSPKLLSGLAPSAGYSWIHPSQCPHGLECYHDLCEALDVARRTGKPLLVDFTGYGCVNCRKMEEYVWSAPGVFELIRDKYVLVSLYVDDRAPLSKEEQHIFESASGVKKLIVTKGDHWTTLENETFQKLSQPWYALLTPDLQLLNPPTGSGTFSVTEYKAFLECGLQGMAQVNAQASR